MPNPARISTGKDSETDTAHLGPSAVQARTLALQLGFAGLALGGCSAANHAEGNEQDSYVDY